MVKKGDKCYKAHAWRKLKAVQVVIRIYQKIEHDKNKSKSVASQPTMEMKAVVAFPLLERVGLEIVAIASVAAVAWGRLACGGSITVVFGWGRGNFHRQGFALSSGTCSLRSCLAQSQFFSRG